VESAWVIKKLWYTYNRVLSIKKNGVLFGRKMGGSGDHHQYDA
jgi:hypothetical protein